MKLSRRKRLIEILLLFAIPIALFGFVTLTQQRHVQLGTFENSVIGRQKAFQALAAEATQYPFSRGIDVTWETEFPVQITIRNYEIHSRSSGLRYEPLTKNIGGQYWVVDKTSPIGGYSIRISCSKLTARALNILLNDGATDNKAEWLPSKECGCSTMNDTSAGD